MDIYHICAGLKAGVKDTDFSDAVHSYWAISRPRTASQGTV